jgi:16S rRNA (guanine527-N7)-methyltransferase
MKTIIESGLCAMELSPEPAARLEQYGELLLEQNKVMNLTAIVQPEAVAQLHMLDCAALLKVADFDGKKVLDVGTGAGFPGMVLKVCQPSIDLTLLDSLDKRIQWLSGLAPKLGAEGVQCVHGRAEELALLPDWREQFDIVTSRAVADLSVLAELCLPFLKIGGLFLAMKSTDSGEEVNRAARGVSILGGQLLPAASYTIPGTEVTHKVVRIEKVRPTPAKYPRRFAKIRKSPL